MFDKLKRLGTDTAVYGVSTVVGRFLTFLLTPFYTHLLAREELGVVGTVYAYIAFFNILYGYGMETAFMRYVSSLEIGTKKQNFSVPFLSILTTSLLFSIVIFWNDVSLAPLVGVPEKFSSIIGYSALILFLDALAVIPFASLRMERKAKLFSALKLGNIIVTVACNLIFLVEFGWGVEGIFLSNIIASALTLVFLLPTIVGNLTIVWEGSLHKALLRFSLPSVPAYIATMMIQVIDRPILESLTDLATVGVYQANYRLGIFMMLIVSMFDFAWRPFFLSHASEPDAKKMFARVLTYFFLLMIACFLLISFFIEDIVTTPIVQGKSIIDQRYWSGLTIVPVVLLAYVFLGISNNFVAGIYIEKKTGKLPLITFIAAAANVITNVLLIPRWNIMGAAIATLVSYVVMAVMLLVITRRIYLIEYEWGRLAKISGAAAFVYLISLALKDEPGEFLLKLVLLAVFFLLMIVSRFFKPEELSVLKRLFTRKVSKKPDEEISSLGEE